MKPEPNYAGVDRCDVCGGQLEEDEVFSGVHFKCLRKSSQQRVRGRKKALEKLNKRAARAS